MEVLKLRIEQTTDDQATVLVEEASPGVAAPDSWKISVERSGKGLACEPFQVDGKRRSIDLPVVCEAGIEHRVRVMGLRRLGGDIEGGDSTGGGYMVVSDGETSFIPGQFSCKSAFRRENMWQVNKKGSE